MYLLMANAVTNLAKTFRFLYLTLLGVFAKYSLLVPGEYYSPVLIGDPLWQSSCKSTGWNDKIVVLKKSLQLYFKTFIEKNQFR